MTLAPGLFAFPLNGETLTCVGASGHEGLSAVLELDWTSGPVTITGFVFGGDVPSFPELDANE